ncbi:amino acid-binding protein [Actinomadura scrupuli]|uniref:amino acid-binding protein n=1 Tax=Actinomadura scrupuli TaxID=559629 RepID=UPI003D965E6F
MILRVRVSLPDRPGSLGGVAGAMGFAGADILQVVVLERTKERALDDFIVTWPPGSPVSSLCDELTGLQGAQVVGVWHIGEAPGESDDVALVERLATDPVTGLAALVEAVPAIFSADWAVLLDAGAVVGESRRVPAHFEPPRLRGSVPQVFTAADGTRLAAVPLDDDRFLLAARGVAPPFHPTEVERLAQLVAVAATVLGVRSPSTVG